MKRRRVFMVLSGMFLLFASVTMVFAGGEKEATESNDEMNLTFSCYDAETDYTAQGALVLKKYVEEATDGKVTVDCYFSSSLIAQDQEIESLMKGNLDMCFGYPDRLSPYMPIMETLCVPYLFKNCDHYLAFYNSDRAKSLFDDVAEELGIRILAPVYFRGARTMNITTDKKVIHRSDLAGMKVRFPNTETWLLIGESLGCNAIPLSFSEVYLGLQTGTIDGQDNAVSTIRQNSLYEVTKSVTLIRHMISSNWFQINEEKWQSMSPELQQIMLEAVSEASSYITEKYQSSEADDIAFLEGQGMSVYPLTDEELSTYRQEVLDYYFAKGGDLIKNVDMDLHKTVSDMAASY